MKRLIALSIVGVFVGAAAGYADKNSRASDFYIRNRVVLLKSSKGSCSGIQVKAPSGKAYVLSAAHCVEILDKHPGSREVDITAVEENGNESKIHMIDLDYAHDLMLMSSPNDKSINIAEKTYLYEKVHTMTHGHGHRTHRTDGELLEEMDLLIPAYAIQSQQDEKECKKMGGKIMMYMGFIPFCVKPQHDVMSTAHAVPGSSGGAVVDDKGELVGIVSNTDGDFTGIVPLRFIQDFLKNR